MPPKKKKKNINRRDDYAITPPTTSIDFTPPPAAPKAAQKAARVPKAAKAKKTQSQRGVEYEPALDGNESLMRMFRMARDMGLPVTPPAQRTRSQGMWSNPQNFDRFSRIPTLATPLSIGRTLYKRPLMNILRSDTFKDDLAAEKLKYNMTDLSDRDFVAHLVRDQYGMGSPVSDDEIIELITSLPVAAEIIRETHARRRIEFGPEPPKHISLDAQVEALRYEDLLGDVDIPTEVIDSLHERYGSNRLPDLMMALSRRDYPIGIMPSRDVLTRMGLPEKINLMKEHGFRFKNPNQSTYRDPTLNKMIDEQYDTVMQRNMTQFPDAVRVPLPAPRAAAPAAAAAAAAAAPTRGRQRVKGSVPRAKSLDSAKFASPSHQPMPLQIMPSASGPVAQPLLQITP
jgi:hypothetical protein